MKNWWIISLLWIPVCSSIAQTMPKIGDCYGGGVVFYVNPEGGGLIAALQDSGNSITQQEAVTRASTFSTNDNCLTCSNWRLPTKEELDLLFFQINWIRPPSYMLFKNCNGTTPLGVFWSNSPYNLNYWSVEFDRSLVVPNPTSGWETDSPGSYPKNARAIRTF